MAKARGGDRYVEVILDASAIEEGTEAQALRVVLQDQDGALTGETVDVGPARETAVQLAVGAGSRAVRVLVGPASATDEELTVSDTISVDVPAAIFEKGPARLAPIVISPYFWHWWLRWCREFVVRGRVICPDGSPVPGAEVCAFDVDWWWWWSSKQQVGCATTDANGAFEVRFRWCCGFWPWWWWRHRVWDLDPGLAERIRGVLDRDPRLELARSSAQPSLGVFAKMLAADGIATARPLTADDAPNLESLRPALQALLPAAPELANLRIWPWWPWRPWWDCTPDLIFRVTQDCHAPGTVIVDESVFDTRWDVPNALDVVLVANEFACCRRRPCADPPCVCDDCLNVARLCGQSIDLVGGNAGASGPDGYLFPGAVAPGSATYNGDRPFAGTVTVEKANCLAGFDYYEIEVDDGSGSGFVAMPPGAAQSFHRHWLQPPHLPAQPLWQHGDVGFPFTTIAGHVVAETREHYEATVGLPADAFWTVNADLVVPLDSTKFSDGTYRFRVVGWTDGGGGTLVNGHPLDVCGAELESGWVLTFDNRLDPDPTHPMHPCGSGTVHRCVTEPDTDFIAVRINGEVVDACGTVDAQSGSLEIDFLAHDPDGHLATFSLVATYAENAVVDLLAAGSLAALSPGSADFLGPTYGEALGQGATAPTWHGGMYRLTVPVADAFPIPCCYQLELRAWKRTVVNCSTSFTYDNLSEYTIGVGVCPPPPDSVDDRGRLDDRSGRPPR